MGKRKLESKGDHEALEGGDRKKAHTTLSQSKQVKVKKEEETPDLEANIRSVVSSLYSGTPDSKDLKPTEPESKPDTSATATAATEEGAKVKKVKEEVSEEAKSESVHPVIDVDQPRLTDVLLIEHAVKNLQTSIDSILQSSPDNEGLKRMQQSINDETNPQLTAALQRYKMKLGAQLKTMHNQGELKIFDQILKFEELSDALEAPKPLKIAPQFTATSSQSTPAPSTASSATSATSSSSGSFVANLDKSLPPIPEIKDPAIRARVFIHKSLIKDKLFLSKREQLHSHNERLEFLGDSVLNNMMTQIAYHRFPDAAEGYLSVLRTKLISNATLMKWSAAYGLDKELKKNTSDETLSHGKMKLFADVFEAYIGGLMTEDPSNYPVVYEWLSQLAEPILSHNEPKKETRSEFRPNAKMELYSLIGSASLGLHYDCVARDTSSQPNQFIVELRTGAGDVLGKGKAENIKIAGTKAAMQALDDKALIEKYSLIRANTPRDASKLPSQELNRVRSRDTSSASSTSSKDSKNSSIASNASNEKEKRPYEPKGFFKPHGPSSDRSGYGRRDTRGGPGNHRGGHGGGYQRHQSNNSGTKGRDKRYGDRF